MVVIKSKSHPDLLFYGRGGVLTTTEDASCCEDESLSSLVDVHLPTPEKTSTTTTTTTTTAPDVVPPPNRAVIGNLLWKLLLAGELPVVPEEGGDGGIDWNDLKKEHPDILSCVPVQELQLYHQALTSIIILDESIDPRATALLKEYNGRLTSVTSAITNELKGQAPTKFTAFVADFNDNLAYSMNQQASHRGIPSQPLPNSQTANEEWTAAVQQLESDLRSKLRSASTKLDIQASFLRTEFQTIPQPAHVDYPWPTLKECGQQLWLAFFPLTTQGMILQLWPSLSSTSSTSTKGQLVFVPLGKLLMVPSCTIHGGGFRTRCDIGDDAGTNEDNEHGNLRYHLYLATNDTKLPRFAQNVYTLPNDKRHELCERACLNATHLVAEDDDDALLMELLLD